MSQHAQRSAMASLAHRRVDQQQFPVLAWQVEKGGKLVERGHYGYRDHGLSVAADGSEIYRLYSMTKPVVAVRILQLMESGALTLDTPVARWLPGFDALKVLGADGRQVALARRITIEDLLTHRAGLSYDFLPDCAVADAYREAQLVADGQRSLADLVDLLQQFPLAFQPGTRWYYSYASDVLARIIELETDNDLEAELQRAILAPLGMHDTAFSVAAGQQHRLVAMFGQGSLEAVPEPLPERNTLNPMEVGASYPVDASTGFRRGGLGLYSTLVDSMAFARFLLNGKTLDGQALLQDDTVSLMWQNRLPAEQRPIAIGERAFDGYGWGLVGRVMVDIEQSAMVTAVGEGGWSGAASTWFWVDRKNAVAGVVLTQFLRSSIDIGAQLQSAYYLNASGPGDEE